MYNNDSLDASNFIESKDYILRRFIQVSSYIIECYFILKAENRKLSEYKEEEIRNVLVADYLRNKGYKKLYGLNDIRFEPEPGTISKNYKNTGYIDIKVLNLFVGNYGDEDEYFVFECKRLKNTSKSQDYIEDGVFRFVKNLYAETMPVAGMIGFVEKSSITIDSIINDVNTRLERHSTLCPPNSMLLTPFVISSKLNFTYKSIHNRNDNNSKIFLGHIMLDFTDIILLSSKEDLVEE